MNSKLLIPVVMLTVACNSARPADHSDILQEKGKTVRLIVLDASNKPIAGANIEVGGCEGSPCSVVARWTQKSGADGSVNIPRNFIYNGSAVSTPANEPGAIVSATWQEQAKAWSIRLMGRATTECSKYDSTWTMLVADDWNSAELDSTDLGVMSCQEGKDVFRTCQGPQIPDAGYSAVLIRSGDRVTARLTGETITGPRELAQLDCVHITKAETLPRSLKAWTLEYSVVGGIARFDRHLKLTQSGQLDVSFFPGEYGSHYTQASPEFMKKIVDFLQVAEKEKPSTGQAIAPDATYRSLSLVTNGKKYMLAIPDEIDTLLENTMEANAKHAIAGAWWESEWKLCKPAAQLTADQMDPPVERLVFEEDGHFSVTWKGGGAEAPGRPGEKFVWVPDYSGSYALQPDHNTIHMTFENGIQKPRDFSGDGIILTSDDKLILRNVWLGTYKAKQKPDVCELTFKRTSPKTQTAKQ